jgi:nicotinamide-nucleotide amidase
MKAPRIELICVGSELLLGRVNTHAARLGLELAKIGLSIAREHTVPDDNAIMRQTFSEALRRADIVISAGGLGPTFDDFTRDTWSAVTRRPMKPNPALAADIRRKFAVRGLEMPPANLRQALVLRGAIPIRNASGTAPGQILSLGRKTLVMLPGPARELFPMFEKSVVPELRRRHRNLHTRLKTFLIAGVPESKVDQMIRPLIDSLPVFPGCTVVHGILASHSLITVKFRVEGIRAAAVDDAARIVTAAFRQVLRPILVGEDEERLEYLVGSLLEKRKESVVTAESCTGGLLAKMFTDRSGSSSYYLEGLITYSNAAKSKRLGVPPALIKRQGAVSDEVARAMAAGARRTLKATYGLSITGVAGPAGGTRDKPVGLVYIACAAPDMVTSKRFTFRGDRHWIRQRSSVMALDLLRQAIVRRAGQRA